MNKKRKKNKIESIDTFIDRKMGLPWSEECKQARKLYGMCATGSLVDLIRRRVLTRTSVEPPAVYFLLSTYQERLVMGDMTDNLSQSSRPAAGRAAHDSHVWTPIQIETKYTSNTLLRNGMILRNWISFSTTLWTSHLYLIYLFKRGLLH